MSKKYISLSICGCCGKDTKDNYQDRTQKVISYGYANMLCRICREAMEDDMANIAKRYLK